MELSMHMEGDLINMISDADFVANNSFKFDVFLKKTAGVNFKSASEFSFYAF